MYGRRNPVLRHFGADDLATQGTLRAIEERRSRGEFVAPGETIISRPTPEFDDYFEFDRPVSSGVAPNARDLLLEEASSSTPSRAVAPAYSHDGGASGSYSPEAEPSASGQSPPPGSYDSSPSVAYQAAGPGDGSSSGGGGGGGSPPNSYPHSLDRSPQNSYGDPYGYGYDRRSGGGGGSPGSGTSPARSSGSRGTTSPRRSYDHGGPTIRQPPFRAGTPASGAARPPGVADRSPGGSSGGRRRTSSSSPDAARSRSPSATPSRERSSVSERPQPSASDVASSRDAGPGAAGQAAVTPRRGLGAKISGRPPPGTSPRAAAGASRRSSATSPRPSAGSRGGPGGGAVWGAGPGRNSARAAPAWAPAAGIGNMRLEDEDEAARVALMLNDPSATPRHSGGPRGGVPRPSPRGRPSAASREGPQQEEEEEEERSSPGPYPDSRAGAPSGLPSPPPSDGRDGGGGGVVSPGGYGGRAARPSDVSEQYYDQYRLRRHRETVGVPDFRFSQPRSHGAHAPLLQKYFSFDEAHPALAEQHFVRSPAQERALQAERRKMQQEKNRAAIAEARSRLASPNPMPTAQQLAAEVVRLERVREAGRARLRELEQEGESLRQETRQVQRRALEAIARSEQMSVATSRSPSPGPTSPSPGLALPRTSRVAPRSRSRSPSAHFYSSRTSGTFGTPPPLPRGYGYGHGYGSQSSRSPGRFRPSSASPGGGYPQAAAPGAAGVGPSPSLPYIPGQGRAAAAQRPVSAPPRSQGGALAAHGSDEAQEVLEMLNSADRLPQHEQIPLDDGSGGGSGGAASHDDPLHRATSVASSRRDLGLLGPDEQRIAMGVYDRSRYEEYQRQVDLEMQRRAVEGGYDSDLERDDAAAGLVEDKERVAAEEEARRREEQARRAQEDVWMDEYRRRLGPEDGYLPQRAHSAGSGGGGGGGPGLAVQPSVLSDGEEMLVQEPYVPVVSPELTFSPAGGYASEGADGQGPHRRTARRLFFKSTVPEPFQFEERERMRPKPISAVKLEQDLALRRAEEEAARRHRFHAKAVPAAVSEPRYEQMVLEAEAKRQLNHNQRLEELAALMERPFSFYYRDKMREEEREALARAAKDPNRFQLPFQARGVPQSTKEERFHAMMMEMEAKREATRRRVEEARQAARERVAQETANRRQAADRSYRERLRAVDPALHPYGPKPLGQVPDFNSLHRHNEVAMARTRANTRKQVTVPHEFVLNGSTPDEQAARARKAEERRQQIILDMQLDSELLPEARWPYKSPRGKVRRNPAPAYLVEYMADAAGKRPAKERKAMEREETEKQKKAAHEKQRREALDRANKILQKAQERRMKEAMIAAMAAGGGGDEFGLASDVAATAAGGADQGSGSAAADRRSVARRRRLEATTGRDGNSGLYREARHTQVEHKVRTLVEDVLLEKGIEGYRYVEGLAGDDAGRKTGRKGAGVADAL